MDDLDHKLLSLLRADARTPVSSLAPALGVSRATVRARIDRLVDTGVIQGFTIVVKAGSQPNPIRAITMIEVEGQAADRVMQRLRGFPEVRALHSTNGRWDILAEIETGTLEAFDQTLRRIRQVQGISQTETSLMLSSIRTRTEAA
ncbi:MULTISPECIES: Lrp/AsnC family transcriptional regulator [unclassified Inquilinus]|jgi:DNA-binding Lrp family transcriptional regulator|uniref:Lrp/AsnC family transcriptional regulator n=1 Tax=unclassified Inquilinus TaxID=2645927 RepID=UPI00313BE361